MVGSREGVQGCSSPRFSLLALWQWLVFGNGECEVCDVLSLLVSDGFSRFDARVFFSVNRCATSGT